MPTPTAAERARAERARSRAEARRRARLAARGAVGADEPEAGEEADLAPSAARETLLQRMFPSAPPLPNRPDPLARFNRTGPLRPVRERIFLLVANPLAWMVPALLVLIGHVAPVTGEAGSLIGPFLTFGSLVAAGWVGWQRPGLYGATSAVVGLALFVTAILLDFTTAGGDVRMASGELASLIPFAVLQGTIGFLGGWYGGYLRRRQAHLTLEARKATARRRR
jgi:hypothetical protein